eukprot:scaffold52296_cov56-Phaeocystis_antarctica.AAC.1
MYVDFEALQVAFGSVSGYQPGSQEAQLLSVYLFPTVASKSLRTPFGSQLRRLSSDVRPREVQRTTPSPCRSRIHLEDRIHSRSKM